MSRKKESDQKFMSLSVRHGRSNVMTWPGKAAPGTGSLILNDLTHDYGNRINSLVYRNILSAKLQRNSSNLFWDTTHSFIHFPKRSGQVPTHRGLIHTQKHTPSNTLWGQFSVSNEPVLCAFILWGDKHSLTM